MTESKGELLLPLGLAESTPAPLLFMYNSAPKRKAILVSPPRTATEHQSGSQSGASGDLEPERQLV